MVKENLLAKNEKARREAEDLAMKIPDEHHRKITMDCIRGFYDLMCARIARAEQKGEQTLTEDEIQKTPAST